MRYFSYIYIYNIFHINKHNNIFIHCYLHNDKKLLPGASTKIKPK